MRRWFSWAAYVALAATALYFVTLVGVPYGFMHLIQARMGGGAAVNAMLHGERATHTSRTVVRPSPELLYSICWYDLSKGPVRVVSGAPKGTYWSVALYRDNTDNFFVTNDSKTGGERADLLLYHAPQMAGGKAEFEAAYGPAKRPELAAAQGVESPSAKGLILIRTLINDEARLPEIDAERRQATCGALTP
jgi:uncharacterized membrane protein